MTLTEYRSAAPFKVGELLGALDNLLGRNAVSIRTLRFYGARGVVPRPMGAPKYARYGYEHLLSIVAAKMLQDRGMKLQEIVGVTAPIRQGRFDDFERQIEGWLSSNVVRENRSIYRPRDEDKGRRIALTSECTIEIESDSDLAEALRKAREALDAVIESLEKKP